MQGEGMMGSGAHFFCHCPFHFLSRCTMQSGIGNACVGSLHLMLNGCKLLCYQWDSGGLRPEPRGVCRLFLGVEWELGFLGKGPWRGHFGQCGAPLNLGVVGGPGGRCSREKAVEQQIGV